MEFERAPVELERRDPLPRIVALILKNQSGQIFCQRRAGRRHHGAWTVTAGGHQLPGESDEATLWRETIEEIGIQPPQTVARSLELHFSGTENARPSWIQLYTAVTDDSALSVELNPNEVSEVAWLYPEELLKTSSYLQPEFRFALERQELLSRAPFGVILDMDDTMFPSREHLLSIFQNTTRELTGINPTPEQVLLYHGTTLQGYVERLNAVLGVTMSYEEYRRMAASVEERIHADISVLPHSGLPHLLDVLHTAHVGLAVGTNSETPRARRILDSLGVRRQFSALVGASEVARAKPAPDMFLEASRRLGIPPERCIVFEDAVGGIEAAKAAGMTVVAFDCGHHTRSELAVADMVVRSYEEITVDHLQALATRSNMR